MKKVFKGLIIGASIVAFVLGGVAIAGPLLDTAGYRYIIGGAALSYVTPINKKVKLLKEKTGGIIHGVCHPKNDYEGVKSANMDWVRFDLTSPVFNKDGTLTEGYLNTKADFKSYADRGLKVMCVTPYPDVYLYNPQFGGDEDKQIASTIDPRTEAGLKYIANEAKFIAQDLQGIVAGIQVTNEMPVDRFRKPLTLEEAAKYIGVQLEAMNDVKQNIIVGYNVADFLMYNFFTLLKPYSKYCDYLGLDLYLGCFEDMFKDIGWYDVILRGFYQQSKLPMIVNEFGYIGAGQALTDEERSEFLSQFGFKNEEEAKENILTLIEHPKFNSRIRERLYEEIPSKDEEQLRDLLFNKDNTNNYRQHFYEELNSGYQLKKYKHNREDQARFYTDTIKHFKKMKFLCGSFAYCWKDSSSCYICNSANCPVETGWGFVDLNGEYKPSYYAIKEAYASWN